MARAVRARGHRDAEDFAADAVVLALQRFGAAPTEWTAVFGWCLAVARNLAVNQQRRAVRASIDESVDVQRLANADRVSPFSRTDVVTWAGTWRSVLSPGDGETLDLLLAGVHDNVEIARLRARGTRAVERSRERIASVAREWNLSRPRRARAIS